MADYIASDSTTAGTKTHRESGYIAEIITKAGLEAGQNCLVDGSLRNVDWYRGYIRGLRAANPNLRVGIIHVDAPRELVLERATKRGQLTGRVVPQSLLEESLTQVPLSVQQLENETDFVCRIVNGLKPEPVLATDGVSWSDFAKLWMQYARL